MKKAKWIKAPMNFENAAPAFIKNITIKKEVKKAVLSVSSAGFFAFFINGVRVGDEVLAPGWTKYTDRVQKCKYDVTKMLTPETELKAMVGGGWATYTCYGRIDPFVLDVAVIFQLDVTYKDGKTESFCSDKNCDVYTSEVKFTHIYDGETVDHGAELSLIGKAVIADIKTKLVERRGEKVREQDVVYPSKLIRTPKGETVIDFGQNMAGYVEVTVSGKRGDKVILRHGEVLDEAGNFYNDNYREAKAEAKYILSGKGKETFKPLLTFYGFRYIKVEEFPGEVDINAFRAIAVHSDIKRTSDFVCGNEKINQLYHNVIWGQKGNFIDVPSDCPQRNERLGWTGDAHVFVRTAAINFDVYEFFKKWFEDMALEQRASGAIPFVIPNCFPSHLPPGALYGDSATGCPWEMYRAYGKKEILKKTFPMMKKWVEYIHNFGEEEYLWVGDTQFGDWLAMDEYWPEPENDIRKGGTDHDLIASCYFVYSTDILIKVGEILGEDMTYYKDMLVKIKKAINEKFIKDGLPSTTKTQTACALLIRFGINDGKPIRDLLVKLIEDNGYHMTTGFVGTPNLLHALTAIGRSDIGYELLLQEDFPSWLFSVNQGATTIWERWDGINEKGELKEPSMNSFNHYAYGSVFDWVFGVCAGINPAEPGYKKMLIKPVCDKRLGFVKASIDTPQGKVTSHWYYRGEELHFEFEIPEGIETKLVLPNGIEHAVSGGRHMFVI